MKIVRMPRGNWHLRGDLIALFVAVALTLAGQREAVAGRCKADGETCRTNRSCCGTSGNNGVCVGGGSHVGFGTCCTLIGDDTTCDGQDDDCNGLADDGYVPEATSCGMGDCASDGSLLCENGSLVDTCNPAVTNGTGCTDDNECTDGDICQEGTCTGTSVPGCCRDDTDCTAPEICVDGGCTSCGDGVVSGDERCDPPGQVGCSAEGGGCTIAICDDDCQIRILRSCLDDNCGACDDGLGVTCPG